MRGGAAGERGGAIDAAGLAATVTGGWIGTDGGWTTGAGGAACAVGCAAGRAGAAAVGGGAVGAAGAIGGANVGRTVGVGTTTFGVGGAKGGLGVGAVAAAGFVSSGGCATGGRGGGATGACCLRMAERTSPGREIWERSIFVLISSAAGRLGRAVLAAAAVSPAVPRRRTRTFCASSSSRELEWVFFSVTPTSGSTSRMALLLTSSSLARSLIRILLIRPFCSSALSAKSSCQPHGFNFGSVRGIPAKLYSFPSEDAPSSAETSVSSETFAASVSLADPATASDGTASVTGSSTASVPAC